MKKFKRIIINAISFVIAMFLLISPLEVLAGTANTIHKRKGLRYVVSRV